MTHQQFLKEWREHAKATNLSRYLSQNVGGLEARIVELVDEVTRLQQQLEHIEGDRQRTHKSLTVPVSPDVFINHVMGSTTKDSDYGRDVAQVCQIARGLLDKQNEKPIQGEQSTGAPLECNMISQNSEYPRTVTAYFNREVTNADLGAIHDMFRATFARELEEGASW